ncbi:hypothetical protein N0V93_005149 [Gnomoniopsis smithogilvyi]|uniref:Uncharacterized protein n=1 Tax=Gnomoniopsis smithogilvyi TaxID=1191159 RepID=A0A9W8YTY3_9PEZI|nr:hypothetical protein N0V93_005149 [Gnomoniopsis smithogilvyi]
MAKKYHREVISQKPSSDGRGMVITEKDVRCTGSDCRHCESERHSRRPSKLEFQLPSSRDKSYSSVDDRLPTPYQFDFRPDPAARQRRRERSSRERDPYYSDGESYALGRSSSLRGASKPISIPRPAPRRSSSMYEGDIYDKYYSEPGRESRSRHGTHQENDLYHESGRRYSTSRKESARVPLGFYDVLDTSHYAKGHGRRRSASPLDAHLKTEEYDPERRRLRPKTKARVVQDVNAPVSYGASPLMSTFDSSYSSRRASDASRTASLSASPPKSVRWGDDPRLAQNNKIQRRAARRNSISTGAGTGAGDNVKSILKNTETSPAPAVQPLSDEQYNALYKSAQTIGVEDRATDLQRKLLQERSMGEDRDSRDMIEGLRKRISGRGSTDDYRYSSFDMPPRRFSGAWGEKASSRGRRAEKFYDDSRRDSIYY